MGFGKQNKMKSKKFGKSNSQQLEMDFAVSTKEDLKEYSKRARKRSEEKEERKLTKGQRIKLKLDKNLPFDFKRPKALRRIVKEIMANRKVKYLSNKKNDPRWVPRMPRYEAFESPKIADSNFVFDIQTLLANFSWKELSLLINAAAGEQIVTKDYSEAFRTAHAIMHQALGVEL